MKYLAVLGRQPEVSMAELEAVVRGNIEWVHVNLSADSEGAIC